MKVKKWASRAKKIRRKRRRNSLFWKQRYSALWRRAWKPHWIWHWTKYWKTGNKKSGDRFKKESVSAFFVFVRLTVGKSFFRTQPPNPFPEIKNALGNFFGHPKPQKQVERIFIPEYTPAPSVLSAKRGWEYLEQNGGDFRCLLAVLTPLPAVQESSCLIGHPHTNSIRSAGWHSSRAQRVSRFSQDTPFPALNFWMVDSLNNFSCLMR